MASIYDLYIEQGANFSQSVSLQGIWDNSTISMAIIDSVGDSKEGSCFWSNISEGEFTIAISAEQSGLMRRGVGKYNVEIVKQTGETDRIIQGRIYVDGEVK